jgi:predicted DCC family thiol-disulfide oxidoreductase YuxK
MNEKIILFDGVCNLCNSAVQQVIKNDPKKLFRFASLQSDFGKQALQQHKLNPGDLNSFILLDNGKIYKKSGGALRVAKYLKGAWPLVYTFILIPPFIRDGVYSWIAKNRYKWFGKQETCWLPAPGLKERFIY